MRRIAVIPGLLLSLVACTSSASSATTIPTSTTLAPDDYYLAHVSPLNCAWNHLATVEAASAGSDDTWDSYQWLEIQSAVLPVYRDHAQVLLDFVEALSSYDWHSDMQPSIDVLATGTAAEASAFFAMANSATWDEFAELEVPESNGATAAVVRAKLGLPSNLTDDTDYCKTLGVG